MQSEGICNIATRMYAVLTPLSKCSKSPQTHFTQSIPRESNPILTCSLEDIGLLAGSNSAVYILNGRLVPITRYTVDVLRLSSSYCAFRLPDTRYNIMSVSQTLSNSPCLWLCPHCNEPNHSNSFLHDSLTRYTQ